MKELEKQQKEMDENADRNFEANSGIWSMIGLSFEQESNHGTCYIYRGSSEC